MTKQRVKATPNPQALIGRVVAFYMTDPKKPHGYRQGRVHRVSCTRGQLVSLTVRLAGKPQHPGAGKRRLPKGRAPYQGQALVVPINALRLMRGTCGVLWRGKIVDVDSWLERHGGAA